MRKPVLVVLAAGMGSRFGGLKQLWPVGPDGQPIIEYSLYDASRAGFGEVVLVIKKEMAVEVEQTLLRKARAYIACRAVFQTMETLPDGLRAPAGRTKPLGTGHAVYCAGSAIDRPFGVISADDFYGLDAFQRLAGFLTAADDLHKMCLITYNIENTLSESGFVSRGICEVSDGRLTSVTERKKIRANGMIYYEEDGARHEIKAGTPVSMSMWGLSPLIFNHMEHGLRRMLRGADADTLMTGEYYLTTAVDDMIQSGSAEAAAISTIAEWHGVTYKEDSAGVRAAIAGMVDAGLYPRDLWG